jgi:lysophospholipase L1-like esterase
MLSLLLSSCTENSPQATDTSVPPSLTSTPTQTIFYLDQPALSYGIFQTGATSVIVDVYNTTPDGLNASADISIEDGSGVKTYKLQSGNSRIVHSLPAGGKQVIITSGGQSWRNGEMRGVFIKKITFEGSAFQVGLPGKRILVYGDSLAAGGSVDNPSAEAWPVLLRKHYSVIVDAYGYRALYDDAFSPANRSELASRFSSWRPDYIWLAIGANDQTFGQWPAEDFGMAYGATLNAIHSSNPQALLFVQSPILQANESPNLLGENLEDYRQQIAAACLARPSWCIFVDGKSSAFPQPDELDKDGVHLTTESSAKYAEAVLTIISSH